MCVITGKLYCITDLRWVALIPARATHDRWVQLDPVTSQLCQAFDRVGFVLPVLLSM